MKQRLLPFIKICMRQFELNYAAHNFLHFPGTLVRHSVSFIHLRFLADIFTFSAERSSTKLSHPGRYFL